MELIKIIALILEEQNSRKPFKAIPVDIKINNGNILLRSFRIMELDKNNNTIKGLTYQEEYIHIREGREAAYCILQLEEIKELFCWYLDVNFSQEIFNIIKNQN